MLILEVSAAAWPLTLGSIILLGVMERMILVSV